MLDYVIIEARRQPQNEIVLTKRIARNQRISVGRTDSADLVLNDDPEISSIHFLVAVSDDECTVTDQNSTNKTWHDGRPITQINISDGESIRCGKTEFLFRLVTEFDDPFSAKPIIKDRHKIETSIEMLPVPTPKVDTTPQADRSPAVKAVPAPKSSQPSPSKQTPKTNPAPITRKQLPPVITASNDPSLVAATDSGEIINWNLFADDKPETRQIADALVPKMETSSRSDTDRRLTEQPSIEGRGKEEKTPESERTRVIAGRASTDKIVRVVIEVAGHSGPSFRQLIDPRQGRKAVIGRHVTAQLAFPLDPFISNRHFEIEVLDNQCLVRDLTSTNGTFLNGQRIVIAPVNDGDRIRSGETDFHIAIERSD